ncbi:hypothetical protein ACFO4O_07390 [Glaciecola siphonariae]|uniref:Lipoprotein n=1 Tax=Glaciecola siphonariae TaxID=521012 RepID=A0ABV9LVI1_9ALTE
MLFLRTIKTTRFYLLILLYTFLLAGCAKTSPQLEAPISLEANSVSGAQIFEDTFLAHGGANIDELHDVNVAIDGHWYYLITKIQPEVTDTQFRQQSEERLLLNPQTYAVIYQGEAGTKQVLRTANSIDLAYNGQTSGDERIKTATALTADAFYLFSLGPLALSNRDVEWRRLKDGKEDGASYYRINGKLSPGIGLSESDFVTLWVDKNTMLTFRVHITLEGFESTKGAHVDTTFLNYASVDGFTLPSHFFERVLGPIRIDAHEWWYTGLDINRGLSLDDVRLNNWSDKAQTPASAMQGKKEK